MPASRPRYKTLSSANALWPILRGVACAASALEVSENDSKSRVKKRLRIFISIPLWKVIGAKGRPPAHALASVSNVLQKPSSRNLLAQAAPLGLANHIARRGGELQALSAAVGEKSDLPVIGPARQGARHDIGENGEIRGKDVDGWIRNPFDLSFIPCDQRRFTADAPHPGIENHRGPPHLDRQVRALDDLRVPFVGFDAGEVHA